MYRGNNLLVTALEKFLDPKKRHFSFYRGTTLSKSSQWKVLIALLPRGKDAGLYFLIFFNSVLLNLKHDVVKEYTESSGNINLSA